MFSAAVGKPAVTQGVPPPSHNFQGR